MKKGFTLVELSIVLVIIGLLIGGILVAQSMISTVKIQRVTRDLQQYSIAFINFHQAFKQEAGDSSYFTPAGLNMGTTTYTTGGCPGAGCIRPYYSAWGHLSQSKMLSEQYAYDDNKYVVGNLIGISPTHKLKNGSFAGITHNYNLSGWLMPSGIVGFDYGGQKYLRYFGTTFDPEVLVGLESKIDDGKPSSTDGKIRSIFYPEDIEESYDCTLQIASQYKGTCSVNIYFSQSLEMGL